MHIPRPGRASQSHFGAVVGIARGGPLREQSWIAKITLVSVQLGGSTHATAPEAGRRARERPPPASVRRVPSRPASRTTTRDRRAQPEVEVAAEPRRPSSVGAHRRYASLIPS